MKEPTPPGGAWISANPEATRSTMPHLSDAQIARCYTAAVQAGDADGIQRWGAVLDARDAADRDARRRLDHVSALHGAARFYAAAGLPVFPLKVEDKTPATTHGLHDATLDPARIDAWWTRTPAANIGLPTGVRFDVLDIDGLDGHLSLTKFFADEGVLPPILGRARTIRPGGWHYLIDVGALGPRNRAGLLPGLDVRSAGGYIVAAPSRIAGARYRWIDVPTFLRPAGGTA